MGNKNEFMKEIIDYISTIVDFCIADGNTYLYAKCVPTVREDNKKLSIGGGNFTVLLSTLATLEFLGTINSIIEGGPDDFWSDKEIKDLKEIKKELREKYKSKKEPIKNFALRPFNNIPAAETLKRSGGSCLIDFIKETKDIVKVNDDEIDKIRIIRNKLAHEFTPKIKAALGIGLCPGSDFVSMALLHDESDVFCLSSEGSIGIDSNALNRKLKKLSKYVIEKLDTIPEKEGTVNRINRYIRETE